MLWFIVIPGVVLCLAGLALAWVFKTQTEGFWV